MICLTQKWISLLYTVLNIIKLAVFILFGGLFFLGQGWLIIGLLLKPIFLKNEKIRFWEILPLAFLSGIIVNYAVVLALQTLNSSLIVSGALAILGLGVCVLQLARNTLSFDFKHPSWAILFGLLTISLLYMFPILTEPLEGWDARWIWFFHAKMIYAAGSIGQSAGWQHPSVVFSHVDYPNLVPVIAAQIMHIAGFWNEYLPKLSLFFMFLPAVFWLLSFARKSFSFVVLVAALLLSFYPWLWIGYMDAILAIYLSLSVLLLGRFIKDGNNLDLISSICCLFVLPYIKNEGILAALVGGISVLIVILLKKKSQVKVKSRLKIWRYWLAGLIGLLPLVLWSIAKYQWNISNKLNIGSQASFERILQRLQDGSSAIIFGRIFEVIEGVTFLFSILMIIVICWKVPISHHILPALAVAVIYCLGIASIYYLTPFDLEWHLSTSINRTMLPVNGCIYVVCYFLLVEIENSLSKHKITNVASPDQPQAS